MVDEKGHGERQWCYVDDQKSPPEKGTKLWHVREAVLDFDDEGENVRFVWTSTEHVRKRLQSKIEILPFFEDWGPAVRASIRALLEECLTHLNDLLVECERNGWIQSK